MKNFQILTDKTAIGLSFLCTIHCLTFPLLIVLLPGFAALQLNNETFHIWMVIAVIPTSTYALTMGCRQHKRYRLLILGLLGMTCLILAVALNETFLSEEWERILTVIGAGIIAYGHYRNYRLCQDQGGCACLEHHDVFSK